MKLKKMVRLQDGKFLYKLIFGVLIISAIYFFSSSKLVNVKAEVDKVVSGSAIAAGDGTMKTEFSTASGGAVSIDKITVVTGGAITAEKQIVTNSAIEVMLSDLNQEIEVNTKIKSNINELVKEISGINVKENRFHTPCALERALNIHIKQLNKSNAAIEEITKHIIELQAKSSKAADTEEDSLFSFSRVYADASYDVDALSGSSTTITDSGTVILTGRDPNHRIRVNSSVTTLILSDCRIKELNFQDDCNIILAGSNSIGSYNAHSIETRGSSLTISGTGRLSLENDIDGVSTSGCTLNITGGTIALTDDAALLEAYYINISGSTITTSRDNCSIEAVYDLSVTNSTVISTGQSFNLRGGNIYNTDHFLSVTGSTITLGDQEGDLEDASGIAGDIVTINNSNIQIYRLPWEDSGSSKKGVSSDCVSAAMLTISNSTIKGTSSCYYVHSATGNGGHAYKYTFGFVVGAENVYVYNSDIESRNDHTVYSSDSTCYIENSTIVGDINNYYFHQSGTDNHNSYKSAGHTQLVNSVVYGRGGVCAIDASDIDAARNTNAYWDITKSVAYNSLSIDANSLAVSAYTQPSQDTKENSIYPTLAYNRISDSLYNVRFVLEGIDSITNTPLNISLDGGKAYDVTTSKYLYIPMTAGTEHTVDVYYDNNRYSNTFILTAASAPTVTLYLRNLAGIRASVSNSSVYYGQNPVFHVTAIYSDSFTKTATGFTTNYSATKVGMQAVTISYTDGRITRTCTVNVTVNNYVTQISAYTSNTTVLYGVTPALYVNVTLADGTALWQQAGILSGYTPTPDLGTNASGTQMVTLTYKGHTNNSGSYAAANCIVTVKNYIASIKASSDAQTVYYGKPIKTTATVTYATGSMSAVSCVAAGYSNTTIGKQTVTLTYTGFTNINGNYPACSLSVTVLPGLSSILATKPSQTIYKGELPILTATAVYADGTGSKTVTPANNFKSSLYGTQTVTLTYKEKGAVRTASCLVNVKPNVTGISVTAEPVNNLYGTTPQFTMTASYENGDTADVSGIPVNAYDSKKLGKQEIIYRYDENGVTVKGTFNVTVLDYPVCLTVTPVKSVIYQNEELLTDSTVGLASGTKGQAVTAISADIIDTSKVGALKVRYFYNQNGITVYDTVEVIILPLLSRIKVSDTTFEIYRTNTPELQVTAIYNDGKTKVLNRFEYQIVGFNQNELGEGYYTVSYSEAGITKTESIYILVKPNISNIKTDAANETTEGEFVDFSMLVTYEDGSYKTINTLEDNITISNYEPDKIGFQDIIFAYSEGGITLSETVTIRVRAILNISIPLSLIVNLDSNTGCMKAQDIEIINNSREAVIVAIQSINPSVSNDINDVLPSKHSNWDTLGIKDSFDMALGLDFKGTWKEKYLHDPLYVAEAEKNFDIGVIGEKKTGRLQVVGEFGKANRSGREFSYLINWIIRLTD